MFTVDKCDLFAEYVKNTTYKLQPVSSTVRKENDKISKAHLVTRYSETKIASETFPMNAIFAQYCIPT